MGNNCVALHADSLRNNACIAIYACGIQAKSVCPLDFPDLFRSSFH